MEKTQEKPFDICSYIKNTPPLTDEEFAVMMSHDNDEMSIDDLDFEKKKFNILDYIVT
jgi:hypothetical protein